MRFEWDPQKAEANLARHGVSFSEALPALEDEFAITIAGVESDPDEQRYVTLGAGTRGRALVVVYTWRGASIRIISPRKAEPRERARYEEHR